MAKYIDLHSDTVTMLKYPKETLLDNKKMVDIKSMEKGGTLVQCFSAFVPTGFYPKFVRDKMTWKQFCKIADKKDALLQLHSDILVPILKVEDIDFCQRENKIGALFTIEDCGLLGSDHEKIKTAYERGVRIASLTWNHENTLAYPNSKDPAVMSKGLKAFGVEMVGEMNKLGIVPDVSHLSDGGFWDVAKYSTKPFIATHSNSRAMTNHTRNLTDEMIKALAEKGGVMGLNFAPDFLSERGDKESNTEDMVRHIMHIRNVGGAGVLAIGTDFDGIHGKLEIGKPEKMPLLAEALSRAGLGDDEIEMMWKDNIIRVFKESWK